jgi:hypothetical protein
MWAFEPDKGIILSFSHAVARSKECSHPSRPCARLCCNSKQQQLRTILLKSTSLHTLRSPLARLRLGGIAYCPSTMPLHVSTGPKCQLGFHVTQARQHSGWALFVVNHYVDKASLPLSLDLSRRSIASSGQAVRCLVHLLEDWLDWCVTLRPPQPTKTPTSP